VFFKVLGPLEIHTTQRVVCFTAKRDMTVLALLLLEANKLVTVDRLTAAVWDAHPPSTAHQQIQTCVWRLRNTLDRAGLDKDLITTRHRGYLLNIEQGTLDTQIFDRETAQARAAVSDQNISGAIAHLRNALALWRGPALAGVQSPVVRSLAARWDERRLNVLEEQFELELRLDRHREVVGDLRTLVDNAPLWERPRGLLMIALHRSGRTSEALEVYRSGRRTLVEQMGIEPGRALQDIHRSILAGGRDLSADAVTRPEETAGALARPLMDVADLTRSRDHPRAGMD
jgi:DNA-binding SARP family transcriptional activator